MKILVITGGAGGLAQAVARRFTDLSWKVFSPPREELDVTSRDSIRAYFEDVEPDLLVCAAGITRDATLSKLQEQAWDYVMAVNFQGAADCASAVLPGMLRRKSGHIVFISSFSALHPPPGQAAYAASKAALLGLCGSLARMHGQDGIRVNAILPGFLETRMTATLTPERIREVMSTHALGRFNTPEAVANFIRFLDENLPSTSGQVFQLDSRSS